MFNLTHKSLFISTLAIAGISSFCLKASADTATVTLDANIPPLCQFDTGTLTDGTLGVDLTNYTLDSTNTANGGVSASVDVTCNTLGAVTIQSVAITEPSAAMTSARNTLNATVTDTASNTASHNGTTATGSIAITAGSTETLTVDLLADYNSILEAGIYSFDVTLEATP